MSCMII